MRIAIEEARRLAEGVMIALGHTREESAVIADHLIDCELRGLGFGGLARALSIVDRVRSETASPRPIAIVRETPVSATFDGGDQVGYLVGSRVTDLAIAKAKGTGVAVVGAYETWYTGMFSYYLERITRAGLVGMVAGSGGNIVAPYGGTEGRYGTNPIAFGFPSRGTPIIWDIGTSAIMFGDVILKMRLGQPLAEGLAFDREGRPTVNPAEALGGALAVWGGHKGSGLAMVVQLLGMLCGAAASPAGLRDCGLFVLAVDPEVLCSAEDFEGRVSAYAEQLRATRPVDPAQPVRVPFERSAAERARRLGEGTLEIADAVLEALRKIAAAPAAG